MLRALSGSGPLLAILAVGLLLRLAYVRVLPAIVFDLALGVLLFALVRRFGSRRIAWAATMLYLLNPASIFVTAFWGQVDSVATFFALLAVYALLRSDDFDVPLRSELWIVAGWLSFACSVLVEAQAAVFLPLLIAFAFTNPPKRSVRLRAMAFGILGAVLLAILVVEPSHPSTPAAALGWLLERYVHSAKLYPYNSVNAFNLWALRGYLWAPDNQRILLLPQYLWGIALVLAALALIVWRYVQAPTPRALLEGCAISALAFFVLATRMHERSLFDGLLLTIACMPFARRYLWGALALSIVFFANLEYALQYVHAVNSSVPGINAQNLWAGWTTLFALTTVATFFVLGYQYLSVPAPSEAAAETIARARNWFDPGEGLTALRGPLDHFAMWALGAGSFMVSLAVPKWYWKPTGRIFDEVYFPRAAIEYLKNLRVYENTHPPLTKLLIALSTLMFGGLARGDHSWGWRFLDVAFGAIVVMLLYVFARRATGSTIWAVVAAGLLAVDGMHYVQSRIATPEGFVVFFSLAAVYAFYRFWIASQAGERRRLVVSRSILAATVAASLACGFMAMLLLDVLQHAVFGWPWFVGWMTAGQTSGPGALEIVTLYFACGFYLLFRYVVIPARFSDGVRELTFPEGSVALEGPGRVEMLVVDGGIVGKGSTVCGRVTQRRADGLVYNDEVEIVYARDRMRYRTPIGSATYANAHVATESNVEDGRGAWLWLVLFALALGALVSSKWYGVMGFGVSFLLLTSIWLQPYVRPLRPALWGNPRGFRLDGALAAIVFIAATVYGIVWLPDLIRQSPDPNEIHNVNDVVLRQYSMFDYHDHGLRGVTHPYASKWFEWPFDYVPVVYFYQDQRKDPNDPHGCCIYEITSMPNPLNLWLGLISVPLVAVLAWRERRKAYALLAVTYLLQWLPWARSPRLAWEYHFYVNIPLICLCNAIALQRLWRWANARDDRTRLLSRATVIGVVGVIVAAFVFFFPVLAAWPLSKAAWQARMWFPTWVLGPG